MFMYYLKVMKQTFYIGRWIYLHIFYILGYPQCAVRVVSPSVSTLWKNSWQYLRTLISSNSLKLYCKQVFKGLPVATLPLQWVVYKNLHSLQTTYILCWDIESQCQQCREKKCSPDSYIVLKLSNKYIHTLNSRVPKLSDL